MRRGCVLCCAVVSCQRGWAMHTTVYIYTLCCLPVLLYTRRPSWAVPHPPVVPPAVLERPLECPVQLCNCCVGSSMLLPWPPLPLLPASTAPEDFCGRLAHACVRVGRCSTACDCLDLEQQLDAVQWRCSGASHCPSCATGQKHSVGRGAPQCAMRRRVWWQSERAAAQPGAVLLLLALCDVTDDGISKKCDEMCCMSDGHALRPQFRTWPSRRRWPGAVA
jgi:hypothetical protein